MRVALPMSLCLAASSLSCGQEAVPAPPPPCDPPTGCLRADRVGGTCQCLEWQLVSIKPVPVRYVVVGVSYAPLGNQSVVSFGHWPGDNNIPATEADFGSRWRSLVRGFDGSERVAALGPIDVHPGFWSVTPITTTSATLAMAPGAAIGRYVSLDVPPRSEDEIFIWMNPAVAVATDYAGERSVAWSAIGCNGLAECPADVFIALAGWLDGTVATSNPSIQAILDTFDAADRAAILRYDPRYDPAWEPPTIAGDSRFQFLAPLGIDSTPWLVTQTAWSPCSSGQADFPILAQSPQVPYGNGETLLLQHSVLSASATCVPQHPGLVVGTSTPDCSIWAHVFVDRAFGTLLMLPASVAAACTAG